MGTTKTEFGYGPSAKNPINGYFRDSRYSPAVGSTLWAEAPILAAVCDPGSLFYDVEEVTNFNAVSGEAWTITLGGGTVASSAAEISGAVVLTTLTAAETSIQKLSNYQVAADKPVFAEFLVKNTVNAAADFLVGMCTAATVP